MSQVSSNVPTLRHQHQFRRKRRTHRSAFRARVAQFASYTLDRVGSLGFGSTTPPISSPFSLDTEPVLDVESYNDKFNYALLILLYTLQGIPMGLSASIPFLLQEKITKLTAAAAAGVASAGTANPSTTATVASAAIQASKASFNANAIFALCSWPFSLKLLWAPIVDAIYFSNVGRRKSWLVPVQALAGLIMVGGANFVEEQLGLGASTTSTSAMNVKGVTSYFFLLYFLMATQDIAVDGWALTMLSKKNRGKGPICNSIGQNIGYFLSFVGFLAFNDVEASETLWRPLLGIPSNPTKGLISLRGFLRFMGFCMLGTTALVAFFKRELPTGRSGNVQGAASDVLDEDADLDASQIGLRETYHRLWAVCQLPAVKWLFLILVTYRLPVALSDNVKFLKAVEYGLSKSTTALLSPLLILPLGIIVPIVAHRIWHMAPLQQFSRAYQFRVTLIPILDLLMLHLLKSGYSHNTWLFWSAVVASTAGQAICNSLQFNAQMIFFASRVDPAIGGSYMTLLNTAANLGGTWPASFVMWLIGSLTGIRRDNGTDATGDAWDPYTLLQILFSFIGVAWLFFFMPKLNWLAHLPDDSWRTHLLDNVTTNNTDEDLESGEARTGAWQQFQDSINRGTKRA
eukprot:Nitzschia sp. Nitz4//scaffold257_size48314//7844//9733//NITZ4_007085-RA/size48314-processed-gene-0.30-mRNA-1//1//CDS//3329544436//4724//frame0